MDNPASLIESRTEVPFIYVWVRTDIPLAQQLVQVGHACFDSGIVFGEILETPHMCLLQVPDHEALIGVSNHLKALGVQYHMFFEPDNEMGFSAICSEPLRGKIRKELRKYALWQ